MDVKINATFPPVAFRRDQIAYQPKAKARGELHSNPPSNSRSSGRGCDFGWYFLSMEPFWGNNFRVARQFSHQDSKTVQIASAQWRV